jgi:putative two-component system response regulator
MTQPKNPLLNLQQAILDNALVGIAYLENRIIVSCNRRFEELFGYAHGAMLGQSTRILYASEQIFDDIGARAYASLGSSEPFSEEIGLQHRDGSAFWGALTGRALNPENPHHGSVWIYADITHRKQLEADLARHNEQLEHLVAERTCDLQEALAAAHAADLAKDEFLANMSHEMRTPLNAIMGMTHLAQKGQLNERQQAYLSKIGMASKTLLAIVNDMLDLSKIAAGRMELETAPFSPTHTLEHVMSIHAANAAQKGLALHLNAAPEIPAALIGDPLRLSQIIANLVSNAIKFTPAGHIDISITLTAPITGPTAQLCISVTDTGIGMTDEEIARLFQPFVQADASITRNYGGTGLGLVISRKIAEIMGGTLTTTSRKGEGSCFTLHVELPITTAPVAASLHHIERPTRFVGARVLVAEDQPMNQEIARELLELVGIQMELAENGLEAINALENHPDGYFDLVLMDIQMPHVDGISATQIIRRQPRHATLPIIAMTAHTMEHERKRCREAGMVAHIGKPFAPDELIATLARWIPLTKQIHEESIIQAQGTSSMPSTPLTAAAALPDKGNDDNDDEFSALREFDVAGALPRFSGQPDRYRKWLTTFSVEAPATVATIVSGLASSDATATAKTLHGFKGRTGMLGMTALHEATVALETVLRAGGTPEPDAWLAEFDATQSILLDWLNGKKSNVATAVATAVATTAPAANALPAESDTRATVLLVDDDPMVLDILDQTLRANYRTRSAATGAQALQMAAMAPQPDLILLDVELPDANGNDLCQKLKADPLTASIPVIFLSSHQEISDITHGLALGAVDYVTKPVVPPILLARVQTHLRLREAHEQLTHQNHNLEQIVAERTQDLLARTEALALTQDLTIIALGSIAETRDNETGNHIRRTSAYVRIMSERLTMQPAYRTMFSVDDWALIWKSAPLHDIGKVGIPDNILLKPGRLTSEEFEIMKRHTVLGRDALVAAEDRANATQSFLHIARVIAYSHHERWDGTGYPEGLAGTSIPIAARLMAVADVYDALISKRVYKDAFSHQAAVDLIRAESGRHFDPDIVACFTDLADEFRIIALKFADEHTNQPVS